MLHLNEQNKCEEENLNIYTSILVTFILSLTREREPF